MKDAINLRQKDTVNNLLADQPFVLKDKDGNEIVSFGMELASEIARAYDKAELQNYLFETYYDYRYSFEEMADIADAVLDKMADSHMSEEDAIEWVLFEKLPKYLDEDAKTLATYAVKGHGGDFEPSTHDLSTERFAMFETLEEMRNFNPFVVEIDGESEELSYREAVRMYGPKKVDSYIKEIDDTNKKYVGIFETICERISEIDCKISGFNLAKAYVTELDGENECVGIQFDLINNEGDVWDAMSCKGYFVDGEPYIEMDDGNSFFDFLDNTATSVYLRHGFANEEFIITVYCANELGKEEGVEGIIIPEREVGKGIDGECIGDYLNELANKGLVYAVHFDDKEDEFSYANELAPICVNRYGYMLGRIAAKKVVNCHVDLREIWFNPVTLYGYKSFKKLVEDLGYGK